MKNMKKIGKMMLKSIIFIAGFIALICFIGEPIDEHYVWAETTFGSLAWAWLVIEKMIAGVCICATVKLYECIEPDAFKDNVSSSTKIS